MTDTPDDDMVTVHDFCECGHTIDMHREKMTAISEPCYALACDCPGFRPMRMSKRRLEELKGQIPVP